MTSEWDSTAGRRWAPPRSRLNVYVYIRNIIGHEIVVPERAANPSARSPSAPEVLEVCAGLPRVGVTGSQAMFEDDQRATGERARRRVADAICDRLAAPCAHRRPMLNEPIRIGDQLAMLARMAGLAALPTPGALLLRTRLASIGRVARRRQRAVARAATRLTLKLINTRSQRGVQRGQLIDALRLRRNQRSDRVTAARVDQIDLLAPHNRKIPCKPKESFQTTRRPDDPVNGYAEARRTITTSAGDVKAWRCDRSRSSARRGEAYRHDSGGRTARVSAFGHITRKSSPLTR